LKKGDAENALKYFHKSLKFDGLDEDNWIEHHTGLVALQGISEALVKLGRYEEALETAIRCREGCKHLTELGLPVAELIDTLDEIIRYSEYWTNEREKQTIS